MSQSPNLIEEPNNRKSNPLLWTIIILVILILCFFGYLITKENGVTDNESNLSSSVTETSPIYDVTDDVEALPVLTTHQNSTPSAAIQKLTRKAELGDAQSQYDLALAYDFGDDVEVDHTLAVYWYQKAADQEHVFAMYNLAVSYDDGEGIDTDDEMAVFWYTKAAEKGDSDAQNNLAVMYEEGEGTQVDYAKAKYWYIQAAKQGHGLAQYNLAELYYKGRSEPSPNLIEAYAWYVAASENGQSKADSFRKSIWKELNDTQRMEARELAQNYIQKYTEINFSSFDDENEDENENIISTNSSTNQNSEFEYLKQQAERGDAQAQYDLAVDYDFGNNIKIDHEKAVYWYQKAADQGHSDAMFSLAVSYDDGEGITMDDQKAIYWYTKAAELGNRSAQNNLAVMYEEGEGTKIDLDKAYYWYTKAARQGNPLAQYNLAILYSDGNGLSKPNKIEAYAWFAVAAENNHNSANERRKTVWQSLDHNERNQARALANEYISNYLDTEENN